MESDFFCLAQKVKKAFIFVILSRKYLFILFRQTLIKTNSSVKFVPIASIYSLFSLMNIIFSLLFNDDLNNDLCFFCLSCRATVKEHTEYKRAKSTQVKGQEKQEKSAKKNVEKKNKPSNK